MQIRFEGLMYYILSVLFTTYLSGYKVYMCVMFVHVPYRSSKLLSTHLKCISKQYIYMITDVLNNIWQTLMW